MMYCCCSTCATFCCNFMLLISAGSQPRSQETRHSSQSAKPTATPGQRPCFGASSTLTTGRISPHLASVLAHRRSLKYLVTAPHLVLMVQHSRRAVVLLRTGSGQALCRVCRLDLRLTPIQIDWRCISSPFCGLAPPSRGTDEPKCVAMISFAQTLTAPVQQFYCLPYDHCLNVFLNKHFFSLLKNMVVLILLLILAFFL